MTGSSQAAAGPGPRVLLVGELNPFGSDPRRALYHRPRGSSGNRLRCILGLTDIEYHRMLDKVNLCDGSWSAVSASLSLSIQIEGRPPGPFVMLGSRVARVFRRLVKSCKSLEVVEGQVEFFHSATVVVRCGARGDVSRRLVFLPHPSGRNRSWNEPGTVTRARELLAEVAPHVQWGSCDRELPPQRKKKPEEEPGEDPSVAEEGSSAVEDGGGEA